MTRDTGYCNTDFDLKSPTPFDALHRELSASCHVLHYTHRDDGQWSSTVEAEHGEDSRDRTAALDITSMIEAIKRLSPEAREELAACTQREFNIGFDCWDTWCYVHSLPADVVRAIADVGCSVAVSLYPMRKPDGTPRD